MTPIQWRDEIESRWPGQAQSSFEAQHALTEVTCTRAVLVEVCRFVVENWELIFAGLIVEEGPAEWHLRYVFYGPGGWVHVRVNAPLAEKGFPSVVEWIHAADWHEREAEDLFGVRFEGHPHLGDFVLHNDAWQESVEPMRHGFDAEAAFRKRAPDADWRPRRIVSEPGAFIMPIGPKFSGVTESVQFLLETVGEDVIRSSSRLYYKWRAVEKLAEGKTVEEALLLAERFAATTAFAHGLAFLLAIESVAGVDVPARARRLRVFLAELERFRQHAAAIQEICESTALVVATSQAGIFEEELLRVSGALTGHRYLFGLLAPGGLLCDLLTEACWGALGRSQDILERLNELERRLRISSSFLDRVEEVGAISPAIANAYSLVGPVARASGLARDLRRVRPYSDYQAFEFDVPAETGRRWLRPAAGVVRRGAAIGAHHGASAGRIGGGQHWRSGTASRGRRVGCRRGAPRRDVPLGAVGRWRAHSTLPHHYAVVYELAQLQPRRGEIRVPGLPDHSLHVRSVRGRERPMIKKAVDRL